jgi:RNA polymerase-binding transcription factor DksA
MYCHVDGTALVQASRHDVDIDFCPDCRGVWLDRGELGEVVDREEHVAGLPVVDAQFIRVALNAEAEDLRSTVAVHTAALDALDTDAEAREHASVARARALDAAAAIERALERLENGSYGTCVACREPIPAARLEAIPSTAHCIRCVASTGIMR